MSAIKKFIREKRIFIVITLLLVAVTLLGAVSYAWLAGSGIVPSSLLNGSILTQYFHCGSGTEDDPFVITRPIHLYNMIYLYQRKENFSDEGYFFQLGYDLYGNDGKAEFYKYDSDGKCLENQYSSELNMEYYSKGKGGELLPIGTSETPFIGTFDGNSLTVKNLHISSTETIGDTTYSTCDVGIFGYVSGDEDKIGNVHDVYFKDVTINLEGSDPLAICAMGNPSVHNTDSDSTQDTVYVGYLAGHIKTSSMMENVYINNCTIVGGALRHDGESVDGQAMNGFGFFGCVENPDTGAMVAQIGSAVASLRGSGTSSGFGGSLDMTSLFNRVHDVLSSNYGGVTRTQTYPTWETVVTPSAAGLKPEAFLTEGQNPNTSSIGQNNYYRWATATAGTYIGQYIDYNQQAYGRQDIKVNYVYSLKENQTTQVTTMTKTGEMVDALYILDGGHYLAVSATGIVNNVTGEAGAAKWLTDENGHWYTYINNTVKYLDCTDTAVLTLESQRTNAAQWTLEDETLSTELGGIRYYLIYQGNAWTLSPFVQSWTISDGNGHYLTGSPNAIGNTSSASDSLKWQVDVEDDEYTFYTIINGRIYYLGFNNGLTLTETETTWTKVGNEEDGYGYYTTVAGEDLYLIYDNGWRAQLLNGNKIQSGTNYLSANASGVADATLSNSVNWILSSPDGETTQIYTVLGNAKYYLTYNDHLTVSTSNQNATWNRDGDAFYITVGGKDYYLQNYGGRWDALPLLYYTIGDGEGNYLMATGVNIFTNTEDEDEATHFFFSATDSTPDGKIRYIVKQTLCYLGVGTNVSGSFANTDTTWVNDGEGHLYADGTDFYLSHGNDGDWEIVHCPVSYTISDGTHYLNANANFNGFTSGDNADTATKWIFSNPDGTGTISVINGNNTYYIRVNRQDGLCGGDPTYELQLSTTNSNNTWVRENNILRNTANNVNTQRIAYENNNGWTRNTTGTALNVTKNERNLDGTDLAIQDVLEAAPEITVAAGNRDIPAIAVSEPMDEDHTIVFAETQEQMYASATEERRRGTYFPIRVAVDGDDDYDSAYPYAVSEQNTGYIVGGAYSPTDGSGYGDIRISSYEISKIENSYSRGSFSNIYTFNGSTTPTRITDSNKGQYTQYDSVCEKFLNILAKDTAHVYGLHFMGSNDVNNPMISTDHTIDAEAVTILGKTYMNYELPESAIDFNIVERGYITFMAGDYYSVSNNGTTKTNNAFFSLHEVKRNADQSIQSIKEISKVYKKNENGEIEPCVYQYADGTYSDSSFVPADYTLAFDCAWITNPRNGDSFNNKYIYYFEIPCNVGEYALGSVEGKEGAYLLYLDIGANGGAVLQSIVSEEGNDVTESFSVDFRYKNQDGTNPPLNTVDWAILQFSINAPEVADPSLFSVNVTFDVSETGSGMCPKGCYTINVVNKSDSPITLFVFMCDDDPEVAEFQYAYKIKYTNATNTNATLQRLIGSTYYDYWKVVAGFTIPPTGAATEFESY